MPMIAGPIARIVSLVVSPRSITSEVTARASSTTCSNSARIRSLRAGKWR